MKRLVAIVVLAVAAISAHADIVGGLRDWFVASSDSSRIAETVVISPGFRMSVAGKIVSVFGTQRCPSADSGRVFFFGGDPQGGSGCIVIEKGSTSVLAEYVLDGKTISETWAVERREHQTLLRRPNGAYVAQSSQP